MTRKQKLFLNKFWKNRTKTQRSFLLFVMVPTLLAVIYYGFIAAGLYVTEAKFALKGHETQKQDLLSGLSGAPSKEETSAGAFILQAYLVSHEIIDSVSNDLDIGAIFNHKNSDRLSRLGANSSREQTLDYWRKHVTSNFDADSGITTLKVRAFTAQDAQRLANSIIQHSENLINQLSEQNKANDLRFAQARLTRAELRVSQAQQTLNEFNAIQEHLDAAQSAEAKTGVINTLERQLTLWQTELNSLDENQYAPEVITLKRKIRALTFQINQAKTSLTGVNPNDAFPTPTQSVTGYDPLVIELNFAEKEYASALTSLEAARLAASQKHGHLAVFVEPALPDSPTEPQRIKKIMTVFLVAFLAWGIGLLGIGTVKEHAGWL